LISEAFADSYIQRPHTNFWSRSFRHHFSAMCTMWRARLQRVSCRHNEL